MRESSLLPQLPSVLEGYVLDHLLLPELWRLRALHKRADAAIRFLCARKTSLEITWSDDGGKEEEHAALWRLAQGCTYLHTVRGSMIGDIAPFYALLERHAPTLRRLEITSLPEYAVPDPLERRIDSSETPERCGASLETPDAKDRFPNLLARCSALETLLVYPFTESAAVSVAISVALPRACPRLRDLSWQDGPHGRLGSTACEVLHGLADRDVALHRLELWELCGLAPLAALQRHPLRVLELITSIEATRVPAKVVMEALRATLQVLRPTLRELTLRIHSIMDTEAEKEAIAAATLPLWPGLERLTLSGSAPMFAASHTCASLRSLSVHARERTEAFRERMDGLTAFRDWRAFAAATPGLRELDDSRFAGCELTDVLEAAPPTAGSGEPCADLAGKAIVPPGKAAGPSVLWPELREVTYAEPLSLPSVLAARPRLVSLTNSWADDSLPYASRAPAREAARPSSSSSGRDGSDAPRLSASTLDDSTAAPRAHRSLLSLVVSFDASVSIRGWTLPCLRRLKFATFHKCDERGPARWRAFKTYLAASALTLTSLEVIGNARWYVAAAAVAATATGAVGACGRWAVDDGSSAADLPDATGLPDVLPALLYCTFECHELAPAEVLAVLRRAPALKSVELTSLSSAVLTRLLALDSRAAVGVFARPGLACTLRLESGEPVADCAAARESLLRAAPGLRSLLVVSHPYLSV